MAIKGVIRSNELSNAIMAHLKEYADGVGEAIEIAAEKNAKLGAKLLKSAGKFKNISGDYRKGWRVKRVSKRGWVIHNATNYQLTHLLEKGHALANGGRSNKFPHIAPVEEYLIETFEEDVREMVGGR